MNSNKNSGFLWTLSFKIGAVSTISCNFLSRAVFSEDSFAMVKDLFVGKLSLKEILLFWRNRFSIFSLDYEENSMFFMKTRNFLWKIMKIHVLSAHPCQFSRFLGILPRYSCFLQCCLNNNPGFMKVKRSARVLQGKYLPFRLLLPFGLWNYLFSF